MSKEKFKRLDINTMPNYEASRWWALVYGINLIADKAEERKIRFEDLNINRIALEKYVDELADDILSSIERGEEYDEAMLKSLQAV